MAEDPTTLDSRGCEALRKALNQRVVIVKEKLVPSWRNRVWVVETDVRPVVVKRSLTGRAESEFGNLMRARMAELEVPFPLYTEDDYLVMEYLSGESCESLINYMFSTEAAVGLGRWLARFHSVSSESGASTVMADAVLSNFIMVDGGIYGLDLEDSREGDPLDDLGQLAASVLGSEPLFTPIKFDIVMRMLESYESESGFEAVESVRPYVSKHLRLACRSRPLFRKTYVKAARSIEFGWPELA
jgi:tRNA A-37 threonylcarbamoyl transferase component Bud32